MECQARRLCRSFMIIFLMSSSVPGNAFQARRATVTMQKIGRLFGKLICEKSWLEEFRGKISIKVNSELVIREDRRWFWSYHCINRNHNRIFSCYKQSAAFRQNTRFEHGKLKKTTRSPHAVERQEILKLAGMIEQALFRQDLFRPYTKKTG